MSREMIDSGIDWIGRFPRNWEIHPVKHVLAERKEVNNPITVTDILSLTNTKGVIPYSEKGEIGNKAKEDISGYKIVRENDIVINSMNLYIGSVGLSKYIGVVSPVYYMLYIRNPLHSIDYFSQLFQTKELQSKSHGYGNGILDIRMRIPMSNLNTLPLPVPPYDEQHRIVSVLNKKTLQIDQLIAIQEQQIEKLKEYKQSVISKAVTKGLDPNVPMKDSGIEWIGEIPVDWEVRPLKTIAKCNLQSLSESVDPLREIEYVEIGNVTQEDGILATERFAFKDAPSRARRLVQQGDVIVSTVRTYLKAVARISMEQKDYVVSTGFAVIHPTEQISQDYLGNYLCSNQFTDIVSANSYGVQYPAINSSSLMNIKIITPPLNEQHSICNYLDHFNAKVNKQIQLMNEKISKLNEYKKSLIYEYVTGKKQVQ